MEMKDRIAAEGRSVFDELTAQSIDFVVTDANTLRITVETTKKQFELIRLWKAQIINLLSPKCSKCTLARRLINGGTLWFCPFGCQSLEVENFFNGERIKR